MDVRAGDRGGIQKYMDMRDDVRKATAQLEFKFVRVSRARRRAVTALSAVEG